MKNSVLNFSKLKNRAILSQALIFLSILTIFCVSSYYFSFHQSLLMGFSDFISYNSISLNGFSSYNKLELPLQHLERWFFYVALGEISNLTGINIWVTYRAFILMLIGLVFLISVSINRVSIFGKLASFSFIIFNPYLFRLYLASPGAICDAFFVLGILLLSVGLKDSKTFFIYSGVVICCLSRQTAIMIFPVIGIYYYFFKQIAKSHVIYLGLIVGTILISNRIIVRYFFDSNSVNYLAAHLLGVFDFFIFNFNKTQLFEFLGRLIVFMLTLSPLIRMVTFTKQHLFAIIFFLIIGLQPILGGPSITGPNIQRLLALGLPLLLPILWSYKFSRKTFLSFLGLEFLISLHHHFSFFNYFEISKYWFLVILLIVTFLSFILIRPSLSNNEN
jgi:hypothetical protein